MTYQVRTIRYGSKKQQARYRPMNEMHEGVR